jgi:hypothetical protein
MTKDEFRDVIEATGSSLMRAARHLGLAESTVSRWTEVPQYAEWYARAICIWSTPTRWTTSAAHRAWPSIGAIVWWSVVGTLAAWGLLDLVMMVLNLSGT